MKQDEVREAAVRLEAALTDEAVHRPGATLDDISSFLSAELVLRAHAGSCKQRPCATCEGLGLATQEAIDALVRPLLRPGVCVNCLTFHDQPRAN